IVRFALTCAAALSSGVGLSAPKASEAPAWLPSAAAAQAAVLAADSGTAPAASTGGGMPVGTRGDAAAALTLSPCHIEHPTRIAGLGAECGVLEVPENPAEPEGRRIGLYVVRIPAI